MFHASSIGMIEQDLYLYNIGRLFHSYRTLGAHVITVKGVLGVRFAVWAPNALKVNVIGEFNDWKGSPMHSMKKVENTGIWALFIPGIHEGVLYKFEIITQEGEKLVKADPYAFYTERRPNTASIVKDLSIYSWQDDHWMRRQRQRNSYNQPMLIYEVHLGTWKIKGKEHFYTYEELADDLVDYVVRTGYTHIEILPLSEHPFDRSWGYQITGYYSATSRYGTPEQLMILIDRCHQRNIGVILDWVPGHFCKDDHGLRLFDGTPLYEGHDLNKAEKPSWGTLAFDFGISEVQSFLISNAIFWMDVFHVDGLRVDAVASMMDLHLDKPESMRTLNCFGGSENLDALYFLKKLNKTVFHYYPNALMIAEDSSSRTGMTSPVYLGGIGFNYKWNMGWMNDMLRYIQLDPVQRGFHHQLITFSFFYAFSENFVLPLSHDEVVHGKKSLLNKMPGIYEEKFANLRLFYGYWIAHPGKKLLFMGGEFGQFAEWKDLDQLDWKLPEHFDLHRKMLSYTTQLNQLYKQVPALWENDFRSGGFEWIDAHNAEQSIISFIRRGNDVHTYVIVICNFSNILYENYNVGIPDEGAYQIIFNSDEESFGGSGRISEEPVISKELPYHGRNHSVSMKIPPLSFQLLSYIPQ
jgi:1,4-alpha-glucan branching enzyme